MYGVENINNAEIEAQEMVRKLMRMCDDLMKMSDAYVTAEQSKTIVDALTKLHDAKQISDSEYSRAIKRVLKSMGFDLYAN